MRAKPKPGRRARKVLITLGLILSAVWLGFFLLWLRNPGVMVLVPPTLPKPNGYDVVFNASKEMEKLTPVVNNSLPDADTLETPALREFVEKNKEHLAQVRIGLELPFQIPFTYDTDKLVEQHNTSAILRHRAARVLYAEGALARRDGRFADALRSFTDILRLGNAMGRNVPMILYTASIAPQSLGISGLRELRGDLDAAQLRALMETLKTLDREREPAEDVMQRENAMLDQNIRKMGLVARTALSVNGMVASGKKQNRSILELNERVSQVRFRLLIADLSVKLYHKENGKYAPAVGALNLQGCVLPP